MGLDITVHADVSLTDPHEHAEQCYNDDHVRAFVYEGFEQSLRGLEPDRCYASSKATSWGFRAGSYSGYGMWRATLARASGFAEARAGASLRDQPFFELIVFTDAEGTIGPVAASDLAKDFEEQREKVLADVPEEDREWFIHLYDTWTKACVDASGFGLIEFH